MKKKTDLRPLYTNSIAILIGIDKYKDSRIPHLGNAKKDTIRLNKILSSEPFHFKTSLLMDEQATRNQILGTLQELRKLDVNSRVLFFFAGHGFSRTNKLGDETGYIATYDTQHNQEFTAIKLEEIIDLAFNSPAKHILFIFDSCFSGQALKLGRASSSPANTYLTKTAYQIITAGTSEEVVSDFHSMTHQLTEAVNKRVIGRDGLLTATSLGQYLKESFASDKSKSQTPQYGFLPISGGGEFVLFEDTNLPKALRIDANSAFTKRRAQAALELIDLVRKMNSPHHESALNLLSHMHMTEPNKSIRALIESGQALYSSKSNPCMELVNMNFEGINIERAIIMNIDVNAKFGGFKKEIAKILLQDEIAITSRHNSNPEPYFYEQKMVRQEPVEVYDVIIGYIESIYNIDIKKVEAIEKDKLPISVNCTVRTDCDYDVLFADGSTSGVNMVFEFNCDFEILVNCEQLIVESVETTYIKPLG